MSDKLLFKVENLQKYFPIKKSSIFQKEQKYVKANKDITVEIFQGETLGLVGESGCGKSTFGRTLIQLYEATGGSALYYGVKIDEFMPAADIIKISDEEIEFITGTNDIEKGSQMLLKNAKPI